MQILHYAEAILFWLTLLFAAICCHKKDEMLEVVGFIKHPEFIESMTKASQTFSGFTVMIGCRSKDGKIKTMGSGEFNKDEKFQVFLPYETVRDGFIRKECYAQVHSVSDTSCPIRNSKEPFKIIFQYKSKETNTVHHSGKLIFSPISCTSKFLWPFHQQKLTHVLSPQLFESPPPILTPKLKQPLLPKHTDFSPAPGSPLPDKPSPLVPSPNGNKEFSSDPAPAPSFDTPASPQPDEHWLLGPSPKGNEGFSLAPAPAPSFATTASPLPKEPLPLGPSPNHNEDLFPAPGYEKPASPLPDEPLPLSPSNNGNVDFSPAPTPIFDTPASPLPDEALPPIPIPPHIPSFTHVPSFRIPQPPPIPSVNKPSPPAS